MNIGRALSLIFSGELFSKLDEGYFVHKTVGYRLTNKDKFLTCYFLVSGNNSLYFEYKIDNRWHSGNGDDLGSNLKMSDKELKNLLKGLSMLANLGYSDVHVELYRKYKKVNWHVFSVQV